MGLIRLTIPPKAEKALVERGLKRIIGEVASAEMRKNIDPHQGVDDEGNTGVWPPSRAAQERGVGGQAGLTGVDTGSMINSIAYEWVGDRCYVGPAEWVYYSVYFNARFEFVMLSDKSKTVIMDAIRRTLGA